MIEASARAWSHPGFAALAGVVGARTGLCFPPGRVPDAEAGFRRAMARAGVPDVLAYLDRVIADAGSLDDLIDELTVGETYFFREPGQFALIRDELLPALLAARPPDQRLRLWSAGCASGEEAYSLAILLEEAGLGERATILGSDVSRVALARAAEARYGPWSLRGVDAAVIERHFTVDGNRHQLEPRLRERVRFEHLNLAADRYPSFATGTWRMDLILCRNVLIYLDAPTVRRVTRGLADSLTPDGWLLLGPSDPVVIDDSRMEAVVLGGGVLLRRRPGEAQRSAQFWAQRETLSELLELDGARAPRPAGEEADDDAPLHAPPPPRLADTDLVAEARAALERGDYVAVLERTEDAGDPRLAALRIRALANARAIVEAEQAAAAAVERHPLAVELHLLHAVLLLDQRRYRPAAAAARRALYLDRATAMGHFLLGTALAHTGDPAAASRAFRNARDLCARLRPDDAVPFADGQRAGRLGQAAAAQLALVSGQVAS